MDRQRNSQVTWVTLILCLLLGMLVCLPFVHAVGLPAAAIFEVNAENFSLFSEAEMDEEGLIVSIVGAAIASSVFSKPKPANLVVQTVTLLPHFPPPKRP